MGYEVADLEHRLANLICIGTVKQADYSKGNARVSFGGNLSDWLPWITISDLVWWAPREGEQVVLLCPNGDPSQGVILPSLYQTSRPAPSNQVYIKKAVFPDGSIVEYDENQHKLLADIKGSCEITAQTEISLNAPTVEINCINLNVVGNTTQTGNYTASGSVSDNKSTMAQIRTTYNGHTHPGDSGGTTGAATQKM